MDKGFGGSGNSNQIQSNTTINNTALPTTSLSFNHNIF